MRQPFNRSRGDMKECARPLFHFGSFLSTLGMGPVPLLTILLHFCPPPDPVITCGLSLSTFVKGMRIEPLVHCSFIWVSAFVFSDVF